MNEQVPSKENDVKAKAAEALKAQRTHDSLRSKDLSTLFLSSEVQRLRKALTDLKEGITHNATDTVWYSGIQTACDRIDEILIGGQGVSAHEPPAVPTHVRLTKDIYDDGQDHHPPGYIAKKGEVVEVREVRTLSVAHPGVTDQAFVVMAGEYEPASSQPPPAARDDDYVFAAGHYANCGVYEGTQRGPCSCRQIYEQNRAAPPPPAELPKEPRCVRGEWIYKTQSFGYNEDAAVKCWSAYSADLRTFVTAQPPGVRCACGAHEWPDDCVQIEDSRGRLHTQRGCQPGATSTKEGGQ